MKTNQICQQINKSNAQRNRVKIDYSQRGTGAPLTALVIMCTRCTTPIYVVGYSKRTTCDTCVHEVIRLDAMNRREAQRGARWEAIKKNMLIIYDAARTILRAA